MQPELFAKVNGEFPGDVGCFVIYFLNHLKLSPGKVGVFSVCDFFETSSEQILNYHFALKDDERERDNFLGTWDVLSSCSTI